MPRKASPVDSMPVGRFARQTRWGLIALTGAVLAFLYLPIAFLILFSFETASTPGLPITALAWLHSILAPVLQWSFDRTARRARRQAAAEPRTP